MTRIRCFIVSLTIAYLFGGVYSFTLGAPAARRRRSTDLTELQGQLTVDPFLIDDSLEELSGPVRRLAAPAATYLHCHKHKGRLLCHDYRLRRRKRALNGDADSKRFSLKQCRKYRGKWLCRFKKRNDTKKRDTVDKTKFTDEISAENV